MRSWLLLPLFVLSTTACAAIHGSGVKVTEARKIADFSEIEVSDGVRLEVKNGPTSLSIEGDDNLVPLFTTEVAQGRLRIKRTTREWLRTSRPIVVRVSTPSLRRLQASGGVEASLENVVGPKFESELSGGVELDATGVNAESVSVEASGGVEVRMEGKAAVVRWELSGGVEVHAKALDTAEVTLDASGGCDLELTARQSITGEASGGVGVKVFGNPPKSRVRTSGGADLDFAD